MFYTSRKLFSCKCDSDGNIELYIYAHIIKGVRICFYTKKSDPSMCLYTWPFSPLFVYRNYIFSWFKHQFSKEGIFQGGICWDIDAHIIYICDNYHMSKILFPQTLKPSSRVCDNSSSLKAVWDLLVLEDQLDAFLEASKAFVPY